MQDKFPEDPLKPADDNSDSSNRNRDVIFGLVKVILLIGLATAVAFINPWLGAFFFLFVLVPIFNR